MIFAHGDFERIMTAEAGLCRPDRVFVLVDTTTRRLCLPKVAGMVPFMGARVIEIGAGDGHKTLDSLSHVWTELQRGGATRHSLLVCLGGGMVTDLGGFAASTFKRGLSLINVPTTLLAMVDASVGGKTGINFGGLKNEIGAFRNAEAVVLDGTFLETLDPENLLSGYAEMLKHGLISNAGMLGELLAPQSPVTLLASPRQGDDGMLRECREQLMQMVEKSVAVKQRVVTEDPLERGLRKALNLGHTVGHAFESLALERHPVLHGYAVAWGLVCELYLSCIKTGFPTSVMRQVVSFITANYGRMDISCDDYDELLRLMTHDKKNVAGEINFSLLSDVGQLRLNQTATRDEIISALDFYRDGQ